MPGIYGKYGGSEGGEGLSEADSGSEAFFYKATGRTDLCKGAGNETCLGGTQAGGCLQGRETVSPDE